MECITAVEISEDKRYLLTKVKEGYSSENRSKACRLSGLLTPKWHSAIINVISFTCALVILLHFPLCSLFASFLVKCLDIYWMNFHKIRCRHSWRPEDER